jgi:hypothetical protein
MKFGAVPPLSPSPERACEKGSAANEEDGQDGGYSHRIPKNRL